MQLLALVYSWMLMASVDAWIGGSLVQRSTATSRFQDSHRNPPNICQSAAISSIQQPRKSHSKSRLPSPIYAASINANKALDGSILVESTSIEETLTLYQQTNTIPSSSKLQLTQEGRLLNLIVLTSAFGFALYTIIDIHDNANTSLWGAYESVLAKDPIITKSLINVIIYLLGDWLSQTAFANQNLLEFDLKRTLRNGFIGLCFGPLVHEYYEFSDMILPPEEGVIVRLQKIFMDQTLYLTIKCSIYIALVGLLAGEDWKDVKTTVQDRIGGVCTKAWKFWPLVHCITYSVIPPQHRVLWVNSVDLVWNAILCSMVAQQETPQDNTAIVLEEETAQLEMAVVEAELLPASSSSSIIPKILLPLNPSKTTSMINHTTRSSVLYVSSILLGISLLGQTIHPVSSESWKTKPLPSVIVCKNANSGKANKFHRKSKNKNDTTSSQRIWCGFYEYHHDGRPWNLKNRMNDKAIKKNKQLERFIIPRMQTAKRR